MSNDDEAMLMKLRWLRDTVGVDIELMFARAQKEKDGREASQMPSRACGECGGSGVVEEDAHGALGYLVKRPCRTCAAPSSGTAHYLRDEVLARLSAWAHEYGAALRPTGADTYGEGMRDAKAQVAAILSSPFTSAAPKEKP